MTSTTVTRSKSALETTPRSATETLSEQSRRSADPLLGGIPKSHRFGADQAFRIVPARGGDHHDIHALLVSILHQPSTAEFHAQLDDPCYEPSDRLLVKRNTQIVAHARITNREMMFGGSRIPISTLSDLVVLPEYRSEGCATELVVAAERSIVESGSRVAFLRTRQPEFFARLGWTIGVRHSYSTAGARDILSRLQQRHTPAHNPLAPDTIPLNIRMWRHVELAALTRLYSQRTHDACGALSRSDAYWQWLVSRRAYDSIYVAINGPDKLELDDALTPIVGYAVMREGRIVELVTAPGHEDAAAQLLARACGDAIERDLHHVRLDATPDEPLHRILAEAGGRYCGDETDNGEVTMVKLFDPMQLLVESLDRMHERAKAAGLDLPCELGLMIEGRRYVISIRQRTVKLLHEKLGRSYLECRLTDLTQLLLGHLKVADAVDAGRLNASTRVATETANVLFPQLPFWRPAFDELQA
ncbi:MAG: GNAT family N-acetyltransferase [Planctomycetota bacterium]|nr:GNAT family N-acetyltransferase [Planctomycetota bacterium]